MMIYVKESKQKLNLVLRGRALMTIHPERPFTPSRPGHLRHACGYRSRNQSRKEEEIDSCSLGFKVCRWTVTQELAEGITNQKPRLGSWCTAQDAVS